MSGNENTGRFGSAPSAPFPRNASEKVPPPIALDVPCFPDLRLRRHADFQQVYARAHKQYAKEMSFFFGLRVASEPAASGSAAWEPTSSEPATTAGHATADATPDMALGTASVTPVGNTASTRSKLPAQPGRLLAGPRIGLTVGKVLGKAHERNRIKRRLRAAIRAHAGVLSGVPVDVVLHARRTVLTLEWPRLHAEVAQVLRTVRKLVEKPSLPPPQKTKSEAGAKRRSNPQHSRPAIATLTSRGVTPTKPNGR